MSLPGLLQRFRALSPERLLNGFRRSLVGNRVDRLEKPRWLTVQAGPLAGTRLLLTPMAIDLYDEMAAGTYDASLMEAFTRAPGIQGGVCWDVGAHLGYHSLLMARLVGPEGKVHAFETTPAHRTRLRLHLEANPELGARVQLHDSVPGRQSGTVDELLAAGCDRPVVVKLDVESAEAGVLSGATTLVRDPRCLWLIEAHHILLMLDLARRAFEPGAELSVLEDHHATASRCFIQARHRER